MRKIRRDAITVERYGYQNETINRFIGDDVVFMVNGPEGRRPIFAESADEALEVYIAKHLLEANESDDDDLY